MELEYNDAVAETNRALAEAKKSLICIRCGGFGGQHLEGDGYLPCYACGDSGLQSYDSWREEVSCTTVQSSYNILSYLTYFRPAPPERS